MLSRLIVLPMYSIIWAGLIFVLATSAWGQTWECPPGHESTGSFTCMPFGSVSCGDGTHCPAEAPICARETGDCLPLRNARVCSDRSYCKDGYVCTSDRKCIKQDNPRVCEDFSICSAGTICTKEKSCLSEKSPRVCSDGSYCGPGQFCAEGSCRSIKDSSICSNGKSYCKLGQLCTPDNKCIDLSSPRVCGTSGKL